MRILFLTPQLPFPPHQGTTFRNYGLIHGLSERHQVSVLSFGAEGQIKSGKLAPQIADPLLALCQRVEMVPLPSPRRVARRALDTIIHPLPDMALRLASPAFAERLASWTARESFDVVHVEGIEMTPYLDLLLGDNQTSAEKDRQAHNTDDRGHGSRQRSPFVIFDDHNCEYMLQRSYALVDARIPRRWAGAFYSLIQWHKLRRYEADACRRAHHVLAVSQTDAGALRQLTPNVDVTVIPNGIQTEQYRTDLSERESTVGPSSAPTLVFTGKMDFRPNVDAVHWFAKKIWPRIRAKAPEVRFFAVGQKPHPRLDPLRADPNITLTGWVEEVKPYIGQATIYVAPLRMGSGTRLKLLEAMAMGKAIVSTRQGAEGLTDKIPDHPARAVGGPSSADERVIDDRELVLINDNDPVAFADAVVALLCDPHRRERLGNAGRDFVRAHYDWQVIIPRLEAVYAKG